jgi:hypothetical protein
MQNTYWLTRLETLMAKHCLADACADFQYLSLEEAWLTYLHLSRIEGGSHG